MGFENVSVSRIHEMAGLTGFSYEQMYGGFSGT